MLARIFGIVALCSVVLLPARAEDYESLAQKAQAAYQRKEYAECGKLYSAALQQRDSSEAGYDAACCWALTEQSQQAVESLQRAGFRDARRLESDTDLDSLHVHARWQAIVAKTRAAEAAYRKTCNQELAQLFDADQADRTDEERVAAGVPTIEQAKQRLQRMNSQQ
jgi:hypothetical protein